jgi:hypothetical protein
LFWRIAQSDWLLAWQLFPILPNFHGPVRKTKTLKFHEILFIKAESVKMSDESINCESKFYLIPGFENEGYETVQYHNSVYSCMSLELISKRTYATYNEKHTGFKFSCCMGKYQTSVLLY